MEQRIYDCIIIGGGPAGYTAALYAARAGLSTLVLEKFTAGGQMTETEAIENYPGVDEAIDGFTLGARMQGAAERFGAAVEQTEVLAVDLTAHPKRITTEAAGCGRATWQNGYPCNGGDTPPSRHCTRRGACGARCGVLRALRRNVLPRQDGCGRGRRKLCGGRRSILVPCVQEGVSDPPTRHASCR